MSNKTRKTSVRLTPAGDEIMLLLAKKLGVSQTALIEMALRHFAEREGIVLPVASVSNAIHAKAEGIQIQKEESQKEDAQNF